ncbi:MAG: alpha/beta hydrolase [Anaerolineae bacterium]
MVEDQRIELRGLNFHYRDWGGQGTPMVLLHGLASTAHIYDLVAPLLAEHFRVAALDQRGHGESDKPETGYGFGEIGADLLAFLDAMQFARPVLVGHSWGGNGVLQFAAAHPDRAGALVMIDGGFIDMQSNPEMTWERTREQLAPPQLAGMNVEEFRNRIKKWTGRMWSAEVEQVVLANFEILPDQTIRPRLSFDRHMQILRALWEQRPPELYPEIRCPVLLLPAETEPTSEGEQRFVARKRVNVQRAEEALAQSKTVWFQNTVHDVPVQRPLELAEAITLFVREEVK